MTTTTRGPVTSHVGPKESELVAKAREKRPTKKNVTAIDPADPLHGVVRFQTTGKRPFRNLTLKIVHLPDGVDAKDDELTDAVIAWLKGDRLTLHDWGLDTRDQPVIDWLRHRIYTGRLKEVEEDLEMLDAACPVKGCDFTFKNNKAGRKAAYLHMQDVHHRSLHQVERGDEDDD